MGIHFWTALLLFTFGFYIFEEIFFVFEKKKIQK